MILFIVWRVWRQRAWQWANSVSIRTKILGLVLVMVIVPGFLITIQIRNMVVESLREQLRQQGISVAREVGAHCADLVLCHDVETLNSVLKDAWLYNRDLRYILILDADGHVLTYSLGPGFEEAYFLSFSDYLASSAETYRQRVVSAGGEQILETSAPIMEGEAGEIRVGLGEASLWATVAAVTNRLLIGFALVTLVGIGATFGLTWWLTRPVLELAEVAERAQEGDYSRRAQHWSDDEIGDLAIAFNTLIAEVQKREAECNQREQMRQFYLQRIMHAQEEERRRLARELHDETGQALASLMVGLKNVEDAPDEALMRERVGALRQVVATTLQDVRRMAQDLRPLALDDLGLTTALLLYADDFQERFHVNVNIQVVNLEAYTLTPALETTVYRVVQEALLNAARHGQCTDISVLLQVHEDMLSVIVEDNGCGFDLKQVVGDDFGRTRLGLYGMRERAELVGGALELETAPGRGCTIYLRAPLPGPGAGLAAT